MYMDFSWRTEMFVLWFALGVFGGSFFIIFLMYRLEDLVCRGFEKRLGIEPPEKINWWKMIRENMFNGKHTDDWGEGNSDNY